ncbi:hypothetical protein QR98_0040480 [Sarcoptes scabiei]|uniref:Uncharacterized protein n=1 Tax=Sarcoptes scabiei TaxID=52283 RepID=A0A132A3R9_SARSC|nr:hypothetical protein QR98_0040480 [Sarcoptes scabiei]
MKFVHGMQHVLAFVPVILKNFLAATTYLFSKYINFSHSPKLIRPLSFANFQDYHQGWQSLCALIRR